MPPTRYRVLAEVTISRRAPKANNRTLGWASVPECHQSPSEDLVCNQARRRLDERRSADCSALRRMGLVSRVGAPWIGWGVGRCVARAATAVAGRLVRRVPIDSTSGPSLSLRPAGGGRSPSPLRRMGAARWSRHDLLAYRDRLRLRPASESADVADRGRGPGCRW